MSAGAGCAAAIAITGWLLERDLDPAAPLTDVVDDQDHQDEDTGVST